MALLNLPIPLVIALLGLQSALAVERVLYMADFSDFTVGEDQLAGHEGWTGSNVGQGVHGIDEDLIVGLGKTGYIGSNIPSPGTEIVTIEHALAEPVTSKFVFKVLFGITESSEGSNDVFGFDFLNDEGEFLASVLIDTTLLDHGVWTDDGVEAQETGEDFLADILNILTVSIDLEANLWSGDLEGTPIFTDIPFTATEAGRNIGLIGLQWQILDPLDPGDNWMLFDSLSLTAIEPEPAPDEHFRIVDVRSMPDGIRIEWPATPNVPYQVEHSHDGITWLNDLPNSELSTIDSETTLTYTDTTSNTAPLRLYRVVWLTPAS